jgi:hypothetical protein
LFDNVGSLPERMRVRLPPQAETEPGHRISSACPLGNGTLRSKERREWDVAN